MATGPVITRYLDAVLKATSLEGRVIGNNVANLATPSFRRSEVHFASVLSKALAGAGDEELQEDVYQPKTSPVDENGNDVRIEAEMGAMVKNGAKARVYLRTLTKLYGQMQAAIGE